MKIYILWYEDWITEQKELRKVFISYEKAREYRDQYIKEHLVGICEPEEFLPITEHDVEE